VNPSVSSKGMIEYMRSHKESAPNKFQDINVWNGRPNWDEIFEVCTLHRCTTIIMPTFFE
jgi:hypothetical protein